MGASTRLEFRVVPGATRPGLVGRHGPAWKVRVAAAPERGRANDALVSLLAETVGVPRSDVEIVAGHTAREKVVSFVSITAAELERRLSLAAERR